MNIKNKVISNPIKLSVNTECKIIFVKKPNGFILIKIRCRSKKPIPAWNFCYY